ncbi:MAG: hypothetical protein Q7U36_00675 [bacterium]|nr:hypothetical protein [bacterium]
MKKENKKIEKEITLADVIEVIKGVENRLDKKIGGVELSLNKKIDGVESSLNKKIDTSIGSVKNDLEKKIGESVGELAIMVQNNFLSMDEKMENIKNELKSEIGDVKAELNRRVHIFDHKDLEFRVEKLEEKVGISGKK